MGPQSRYDLNLDRSGQLLEPPWEAPGRIHSHMRREDQFERPMGVDFNAPVDFGGLDFRGTPPGDFRRGRRRDSPSLAAAVPPPPPDFMPGFVQPAAALPEGYRTAGRRAPAKPG